MRIIKMSQEQYETMLDNLDARAYNCRRYDEQNLPLEELISFIENTVVDDGD